MGKGKKKAPPRFNPQDVISKLPVEIIHDILIRLNSPEEAGRTSVLSTTWHRLFWRSYPVVEYRGSDKLLDPNRYWCKSKFQTKFQSFVASTTKRLRSYLLRDGMPLSELKISVAIGKSLHKSITISELLDELLESVSLLNSVFGSPLKISIESTDSSQYIVPESIFLNCRRTQVMKLGSCSLEKFPDCSSFLAEAKNLESLRLVSVVEMQRLGSNLHNLKFLEVRELCRNYEAKDLDSSLQVAPLLETLDLTNRNLKILSPSAAPNLKVLDICGFLQSKFTQEELDELTSNLPSLESLSFALVDFASRECWLGTSTPAYKLREFSLYNCSWFRPLSPLKELKIDAPNLSRMCYNPGAAAPPISKVDLVNVASDFQFQLDVDGISVLDFGGDYSVYEWFDCWRVFLATCQTQFNKLIVKLHNLRGLVMMLPHIEKVESEAPWSSLTPNLVVVENLILETGYWRDCQFTKEGNLLHGCFSICRPKLMSVVHTNPKNSELLLPEYICGKLMNRKALKCCCESSCWQHCLKDVKIQSRGREMVEIYRDVVCEQYSIVFRLTW
ncbi:hypothetical protein LINPERPRIM_LOCUS23487 [Linum perenne]